MLQENWISGRGCELVQTTVIWEGICGVQGEKIPELNFSANFTKVTLNKSFNLLFVSFVIFKKEVAILKIIGRAKNHSMPPTENLILTKLWILGRIGQVDMGGKGIPGDGDNMDKGPVVGRCFSGCSIEFVLIFVSMCVYVVCVCLLSLWG